MGVPCACLTRVMTHPDPHAPLGEADYADLDALLTLLRGMHEDVPPLETFDGFLTALACGPRAVPRAEYLPVLLGTPHDDPLPFEDPNDERAFLGLLTRRWDEIVAALEAPVDSLDDTRALQPALTDWDGARDDLEQGPLSDDDREALAHWPQIGEPWANGFLLAVDHWSDEWDLPDGDENELVDDCLAAFEVLVVPTEELDPA